MMCQCQKYKEITKHQCPIHNCDDQSQNSVNTKYFPILIELSYSNADELKQYAIILLLLLLINRIEAHFDNVHYFIL